MTENREPQKLALSDSRGEGVPPLRGEAILALLFRGAGAPPSNRGQDGLATRAIAYQYRSIDHPFPARRIDVDGPKPAHAIRPGL